MALYITISVWNIYNEGVSLVIKSDRKLTVIVKFEVNV